MQDGVRGSAVALGPATDLWFGTGDPVRAASGVAPFGDGWVIAQDDANHAAWWRPPQLARIRLFPPHDGADLFGEADGTKHLKPDLEAVCPFDDGEHAGVLLLGSGSLRARMRVACLTTDDRGDPEVRTADLEPLYRSVAAVLPLGEGALNLEAACVVDGCVRWFQRGNGPTGVPSASVDVPLADLLAAVHDAKDPAELRPEALCTYELGHLDGVGLQVTSAVTLPDGHLVVAATAEDTPNAVDDGPINGSALGLLDDRALLALEPLPSAIADWKVEGLASLEHAPGVTRLLAVADQDDPRVPSPAIELTVRW